MELKLKYMELLNEMGYRVKDKKMNFSGYYKDEEGEKIHIDYGFLPYRRELVNLDKTPIQFIAGSLIQRAIQNQTVKEELDKVIAFYLNMNVKTDLQLRRDKKGFLQIKGQTGSMPSYLNVLYPELASIITATYNSLAVILDDLGIKGNNEKRNMFEEPLEDVFLVEQEELQFITMDELKFKKDDFLRMYKKFLEQKVDDFERNNVEIYDPIGNQEEIEATLERIGEELRKKSENYRGNIDALYALVEKEIG